MGKLARTIPVVVLVAMALIAVPSGASAATTVGQTFFPGEPFTCNGSPDWEVLQTGRASGPSYAAPSDGVLTSWSFEAGTLQTVMTLRVFRPTGTAHQYTVIADGSELKTIAASSGLNTFPTQIPVQAGDFVGIHSTSGTCGTQTINSADTSDFRFATATAVGAMGTYTPQTGFIYDISAKLEPDCDKDGRGDETQDSNTSSCQAAALKCKGAQATIVGTSGNDVRSGTPGRDVMVGQGGSDRLSGLAGKDLICGGAGKDKLLGGKGKDTLLGQAGKDKLKGGGGKDICKGGKGNDTASKCEVEKSI
jgi:Ca2+-binding RTX toxin-like protein